MTSLARQHDCLLLDLDGTVFRGHEPTVGAIESLAAVESRVLYVTNNASRAPAQVAEHLRELGFAAGADDVVTSAQSAAHLLAAHLPQESKVLVVGTDALASEVSKAGLRPVRMFDDAPVAVVQGHSPDTGWPDLAEAALAIRAGALWVAANVDLTLPSERGLLPGNGSMVAALRVATGQDPLVAGKPQPTLMNDALSRGTFTTPLVVGDRLDTDIAGAVAAGLPSLMVLTGVSTAAEAVHAVPAERPQYLAPDLRGLHGDVDTLRIASDPAWRIDVDTDSVTVHATGQDPHDDLSVVRATAHAVWGADLDGAAFTVSAGDDTARQALQRWSLLPPLID
ncbi:HAD-IIA family hydrolase [Mycolicibacterium fortuitum]|uniref:Putative HAD superfamily sugar phosphatase n=1 Tax=Mycolicibacterium fortuitum subsp. fortuitum DSM 46621 = ATCC 6841 = JCM 6387 TaxID=1214102 RepID=K0UQZ9_MYCFO|nr:HAD-IIA family hydrolase [Mycolicibacterium fortuitum]AIY46986.1 4-nitrophenylphosphatase [Mycobacterium sp. VKM Ac-1817D]AMD55080.1 HAD family hydrolase [Mycolicibacterium fortuitum subsp. fortuitum DSM 46621 = ATCC 6841 = JCM 6387]EJZ04993.1 putative HAD superfamily sugar phosphatase [Mycolicibacterium fortuitum subsp. fortuitum DSM 46621 = ATCC 6841 = JCM 6387]WEV30468.1 HAD-IIA family hydrolase [Mycolicibacterium fortuitum]CRL55777.1 putative HAD superfamily sugar phosphatase [Mycolicib